MNRKRGCLSWYFPFYSVKLFARVHVCTYVCMYFDELHSTERVQQRCIYLLRAMELGRCTLCLDTKRSRVCAASTVRLCAWTVVYEARLHIYAHWTNWLWEQASYCLPPWIEPIAHKKSRSIYLYAPFTCTLRTQSFIATYVDCRKSNTSSHAQKIREIL